MLKSWQAYANLNDGSKAVPHYVDTLPSDHKETWLLNAKHPKLVNLGQLAAPGTLWELPAYAQNRYVYDDFAIIQREAEAYQHTATLDRLNQFDELGPAYQPEITDITIEYHLGLVVSEAARLAHTEAYFYNPQGALVSGKLLVIDALRTVNSTFLLASANPLAVEEKLLSMPGMSAHNKGMAVDLTFIYFHEKLGAWCDVDMLGHIDHPDMQTNHRNYTELSEPQKHNRLALERLMLRGAFAHGFLLAPLREEFWDFRFPEDGLDLWRVLESISRSAEIHDAFEICSHTVDDIRALYRAGGRDEAYLRYELNEESFQDQCGKLFVHDAARTALQTHLHITLEELIKLKPFYHGHVGLVYDTSLPEAIRQANPALHHLFK